MQSESQLQRATPMDAAAASPPPDKHIVDVLIEERAPKLSSGPLWPIIRPPLYTVLNYNKAIRMADQIAPMSGHDALESVSGLLSVKLEISGIERMPNNGAFLLLSNHPTPSRRCGPILFSTPTLTRRAYARASMKC
jgi:hypothetical protein